MSGYAAEKGTGRIAALLRAEGYWGTHSDRWNDAEWQDKFWTVLAAVLVEAGVGFVEQAWDEAISIVCDCGDFDGHPGDCAATPLIHAACVTSPAEGRA